MRMMLCLLLLALLRAVDPDVAATHLEKLALRHVIHGAKLGHTNGGNCLAVSV